MGLCAYAKAFANAVCSDEGGDAVVMTTACDQMRRLAELAAAHSSQPVHLMHVPAVCESPNAFRMYAEELKRLSRFLERIGGRTPDKEALAGTMLRYDESRRALRGLAGHVSGTAFAQALASFHRDGPDTVADAAALEPAGKGVALALVGGPLLDGDVALLRHIEAHGGVVALNGTTNGERTLPAPFSRRQLRETPFEELVDAYFGAIPDAFRRPNAGYYRWLREAAKERGVRGIIQRQYPFCDTWRAEARRLEEWSELPVLVLDAEECVSTRAFSRMDAFLEALK